MQIPLKDIATVGKIKTSIEDYKENCRQLTAGGTKKARQAWYELAIRDNISVNMGDTIYYINTGSKKHHQMYNVLQDIIISTRTVKKSTSLRMKMAVLRLTEKVTSCHLINLSRVNTKN